MTQEHEDRTKLIENRKAISVKALNKAGASEKKFLIDAGFIGGFGTTLTAMFASYGGSKETAFMGVSSAALIAGSHVNSSINKRFYTKLSEETDREVFELENGTSIEGKKTMLFETYEAVFRENYKGSLLAPLFSMRSAAIGCGVGTVISLAVAQTDAFAIKRDEDLETKHYLNVTVCSQGDGEPDDCSEMKLFIPSFSR